MCPALTNPANGVVSFAGTTFRSVATYTCNDGYVISGNEQRTCLETGEWSGQIPTCVSKSWVFFQGEVTPLTHTLTHSLSCLVHSLSTSLSLVPQPGCGDPGVPSNGRRMGDVFSSGSVVFFRCFDDYDLIGSKYRTCQSSGRWSGTQPTCRPFNSMSIISAFTM